MSIHWVRNVLIDGEKSSLNIQLGEREISDKCYVKVQGCPEKWFDMRPSDRETVLKKGVEHLKEELKGRDVTFIDGEEFDWV